jgi:copper chaperone CopZ
MKNIFKYSILVFLFTLINSTSNAQDSKNETAEFKVDGVCNMCKSRIENAAYIKGVKFVEWSKEAQTMKVVYNGQKTTIEDIQKGVAAAGHSTDLFEADSAAYTKLPACCAYDDGAEVH